MTYVLDMSALEILLLNPYKPTVAKPFRSDQRLSNVNYEIGRRIITQSDHAADNRVTNLPLHGLLNAFLLS